MMPPKTGSSKVKVVIVGHKRNSIAKNENTKAKTDLGKAEKPKLNKPCWSWGKIGHWSKDCPVEKARKSEVVAQANTVLGTTSGPVANVVVGEAVASETKDGYVTYNLVLVSTSLSNEWLIDTRANVHICADITLFVSYQ